MAAVALGAFALPAVAGGIAPPAGRQAAAISLPLLFDSLYQGDIAARIDADGNPSLDVEQLIALLGERLSPATRDELRAAAARDSGLSIAAAARSGLVIAYDPATLDIAVTMPLAVQGKQALSAQESQRLAQPRATIEQVGVSATATVSAQQRYTWGSGGANAGFAPFGSAVELAANIGGDAGVSMFGDVSYHGGRGGGLERGNLLILHDDLDRAIRYAAGDVAPVTAGFQAAPLIGGVSVQRLYGVIQPFRNVRPSGQFNFILERASMVDVVVNGSVLRTIRLEAGQYNLRDFPFFNGLNQVELYVADDSGRRLLTSFSQYFSARLLDRGVFEFGATAGVLESNGAGRSRYGSGRPALSGYARFGATGNLMLGANAQASREQAMAGVEGALATPVGTLVGVASLSHRRGRGGGHALLLGYEGSAQKLGPLRRPQLNLEVQTISRDFATLGLAPTINRFSLSAQGRMTAQLPGAIGLGVSLSKFVGRGAEPDQLRYAFTAGRRLWRMNLTATYERVVSTGPLADRHFLLTVSLPVGGRASARATFDSRGNRGSVEYSRFQPDEIDSFGVRGAIGRGDEGYNVAGELSYNANRFGALLEHNLITDTSGALRSQESALSVHSQIAFAGDRLAFGRPVGPRFAIVAAHPSLHGSSVNVRQGPGREKPQARSDRFGPALAPAGNSYTASELRLDADNLPTGYDLGEAQYVVRPAPAAGYSITVGSDASRVIIGTAVAADGAPIGLQGGTLRSLDDAKFAPVLVFTNRAGRFAGNGLKPGRYALTLGDDEQFHATLDVPAKAKGVVMLGTVRITEEKR